MAPVILYVTVMVLTATHLVKGVPGDSFARNRNLNSMLPKKLSERNVEAVIRQEHHQDVSLHGLGPDVPPLFSMDAYRNNRPSNLLDIEPVDSVVGSFDYWNQWSDWSVCSRSCGGGVAVRSRRCAGRFSSDSGSTCDGPLTQHKLCKTQLCPRDSREFREVQCSQQDEYLFHSRKFNWVPYYGRAGNTCELLCMAAHLNFYHSFGTALDGTRCGPARRDVCISGSCVKIGCDMVIGSNKTEDACGVCEGNNGTCFHYQNVFDRLDTSADSGYTEVAKIPIGATHIRVKEYSKNYLALKETDQNSEKFTVNGNWVVGWPGEYKTAGTIMTYKRQDVKETFEIIGPTTKILHIMVLFIEGQPLIEYEYWIPNALRPVSNGVEELNVHKLAIQLTEEDYWEQILAAELDPDSVVLPTLPKTTTLTTTTTTTAATTTTALSTTTESRNEIIQEAGEPKLEAYIRRPSSKTKSYCQACKKSINKKRHFCISDFVVHVQIISKRRLQRGRYTRYEVEVLTPYKSEFKLMRREYMWVPSIRGGKLRPYRHYLMMGKKVRVDVSTATRPADVDVVPPGGHTFETRLVADYTDYWFPWRKSYDVRMSKIASHINCKRYQYRSSAPKLRQRMRKHS